MLQHAQAAVRWLVLLLVLHVCWTMARGTAPTDRLVLQSHRVAEVTGDGDGFPDTNETVDLYVTLWNKSSQGLTNVVAQLATTDPKIERVHLAVVNLGSLPANTSMELPIAFRFKVSASADRSGTVPPVTCSSNTCSNGAGVCTFAAQCQKTIYDEYAALFTLELTASEFSPGEQRLESLSLDLDLNSTAGAAPTSAFTDGFESGLANFVLMNLDSGVASNALSDGTRCRYNDPDLPGSNFPNNPSCYLGFAAGQNPVNDWHVHGLSSPDGGRAYAGTQSLHYGRHTSGNAGLDTYALSQMDALRSKALVSLPARVCASDPAPNKRSCDAAPACLVVGGGPCVSASPQLSFKQQISTVDSRSGTTNPGQAADRGVVQVQLAGNANCSPASTCGNWRKLVPFENAYDAQASDALTHCAFDPTDDGNNEDSYSVASTDRTGPSSTCYPEFVFSYLGNTDLPFGAGNIGRAGDGPGLQGSLGQGTWVRSSFDLSRYRGQSIRMRFLFTSIKVQDTTTVEAWKAWNPKPDDDGWYVDDLRVGPVLASAPGVTADATNNGGLPATGACCAAPAPCQITTAASCATLGGSYAGDDSTCRVDCTDPGICLDPPGAPPRPLWHENQTPSPTYPNYATMSQNLNLRCSLKVLASMISKALEDINKVTSPAGENDIEGDCYCSAQSAGHLTRSACETACTGSSGPTCTLDSGCAVWLPTDIFKRNNGTALFWLKKLGWLDRIKSFIVNNQLSQKLTAMNSGLRNADALLAKMLAYVDEFTDGYNLGGYSEQRPDLHLCVGYGGHWVHSQMANLAGGSATIGSRYRSWNLSAKHRAQFRAAGFELTAFGKSLPLLPGLEANIQIDGIRPWDASKPFGFAFPSTSITLDDLHKYDIFHLLKKNDTDVAQCLDSNQDGRIDLPGELVIKDLYPFQYLSATDNQTHTWPRQDTVPENPYGWETRSAAVLSAGLELEIVPEPIHRPLPPISWGLFTVEPFFDLDWGLHWTSGGNILRAEVLGAINKSIPSTGQQLDATVFARGRTGASTAGWPLQADDLTADDGASVRVVPSIGAKVNGGLVLNDQVSLGLTMQVAVGADIEPRAAGGLVDAKYALVDALNNSNPPLDLPCTPTYTYNTIGVCSDPQGGTTYSCSDGDPFCEDYGSCIDASGIRTEDTTRHACVGDAPPPSADPDNQGSGACCVPGQPPGSQCAVVSQHTCSDAGGTVYYGGLTCDEVNDCEIARFIPYTCIHYDLPVVSGWEGPGCHPLTNGFPSACGCAASQDCAPGETCSSGRCTPSSPDQCSCNTSSDCVAPRVCSQGACVVPCTTNAQCGSYRVCVSGSCAVVDGSTPPNRTPFAEQIAWGMKPPNQPSPAYAVSTYALSDLAISAFISGAIDLGAHLHIFGWDRDLTLYDYSNVWNVGSPSHKIWYQPGLQSDYENACWPPNLGPVTNWQPSEVTRYPQQVSGTGHGNAGNWDTLVGWCKPRLPNDVQDPAQTEDGPFDIAGSLDATDAFANDVAQSLWATQQLCIDGQPLAQYLTTFSETGYTSLCHYTYQGNAQTFPCRDLGGNLLLMWGCLDANANTYAARLAAAFPTKLTTYQGRQVFDLTKILIQSPGRFEFSNIQPAFRTYTDSTGQVGIRWYNAVKSCFETHFAALQSGDVSLAIGSVGPCCGDGALENGEQCDDGNTVGGDGCSALCQIERHACPLGGPPYVNYVSHDLGVCHASPVDCQAGCEYFECTDGCGCLCPAEPPTPVTYPSGSVGSVSTLAWDTKSHFSWAPASNASGYDVQRGFLSGLRTRDYGTCLSRSLSAASVADTDVPAVNNGFQYLVRGVNAVGPGSFGTDSTGYEIANRNPAGCP